MTDRLIREFYGIDPPQFLVLTGTLRLPIRDVPDVSTDDIGRQQRLLRELEHQPERHLMDASVDLISEKTRLVDEEHRRRSLTLTRGDRSALRSENHQRWVRLCEINQDLSSRLADRIDDEKRRLNTLRESFQTKQLLQSREFSAWAFPESLLREFFGTLID